MNPSYEDISFDSFGSRERTKRFFLRPIFKVILSFLAVFVVTQAVLIGVSGRAFAVTSDTTLVNKAMANGLYKCYYNNAGEPDKYMKARITPLEALSVFNVTTEDGHQDGTIGVPTKYGNTLRDGDVSCEELFTGWNVRFGTGSITGLLGSNTMMSRAQLLTTLGYEKTDESGGGGCAYYTYRYGGNTNARTNTVCASSEGTAVDSSEMSGNLRFYVAGGEIHLADESTYDEVTGTYMADVTIGRVTDGGLPTEAVASWCNRLGEIANGRYDCTGYQFTPNEMSMVWVKTDESAKAALRNLTEFKSFSQSQFNAQDAYDLYMGYLFGSNSIYKDLYVDVSNGCSEDRNASGRSVPFNNGEGGVMWCEVLGTGLSSDDEVNVLKNGHWYYLDESVGPFGVIEHLRNLDIAGLTLATADENTGAVSETISIAGDGSACLSGGGARSLGWIICPILEWLGNASEQIYGDLVAPALEVDPKLFVDSEETGKSGARMAWGTFRDIANVCFVILFLVVIFSQLTGVGIDNYGIKKILPKLIVCAILVNLSYLVCLITVDLSNILGAGFQSLFENLGKALPPPQPLSVGDDDIAVSAGVMTGMTGVGILGALVAGGVAIYANPAILLSLLVSALGIIIALFFLFLLLSVREAAIIVLVVVSPVAMILYSLPNTKRVFDRWLKFFEGLLLVFPICGLLVGAGNYVSKLLISTGMGGGGFFSAFTAMVIGILPVFLIPMVLKSSFTAMGKIGAGLANLGGRARVAGTRAMRGTELYKGAQELGAERRTRIRAGVDTEGRAKNLTGIGRLMRGGRRGIARARAQYLKDQDARIRTEGLMGVGYEAASIAQEKRAEADEVANYMMLINRETDNGANEGRLIEMFDNYATGANKNKAGAVAAARIAGRRKDTASRFMGETIMSGRSESGESYDQDIMRSVAKEMSEGERSGNYRAGTPVGFEYASRVNQGTTTQAFSDWAEDPGNISEAMNHHITNSSELVGAQNSSLGFIAGRMEPDKIGRAGGMSEEEAGRLRNLARETIQNRGTTGVWDTTKEENIYRIAYGDEFRTKMAEDRARGGSENRGGNAPGGDERAKEQQVFKVKARPVQRDRRDRSQ